MHAEAEQYVNRFAHDEPVTVVEIGSRDINGEVRHLFPKARWHGIDLVPGRGVDEVADGAEWQPSEPVDVVVCCAVLEHAENWRDIAANAARMLKPGGRLILTTAGPNRSPHGSDGGPLPPGEYYRHVDPAELALVLNDAGFDGVAVEFDQFGIDTRVTAVLPVKPKAKPRAKPKGE